MIKIDIISGFLGSGKTTLIKALAGLFDNYIGEILLNGKNLREIKIKERAKIISYVAILPNSNLRGASSCIIVLDTTISHYHR